MEAWATLLSAIGAFLIFAFGVFTWREQARQKELRADNVLAWALLCIRQMELLHSVFICKPIDCEVKFQEIAYEAAALIGQGRLFFRNTKEGWRPKIFDELKIIQYIALKKVKLNDEVWSVFQYLSYRSLRRFIDLAQAEVGRRSSISKRSSEGGISIDLEAMVDDVEESDLNFYFGNLRS